MTELTPAPLLNEVRLLIDSARERTAAAVNAELTLLYWRVGRCIHAEVLGGVRAGYGQQVIASLAKALTADYGRGWSEQQLRHCLRAAEIFTDEAILSAARRELSWTHIKALIYIDDPLKREFYLELCRLERWSSRQLQERMNSMLFERSAISRKPAEAIRHDLAQLRQEQRVQPDVLLKDPYVLDFLGLNDHYLEKDLEDAILREMEQFLLELGAGFTFVARQKRLQIDNDDFYIDLLFYNRKLKRLVAVELKLGAFKAEHKSQMELYLRWLAKHEQEQDELPPLGIILCAGKKQEQIELLELDKSGIHVAEYLTVLPSRETLQAKLHQSIETARLRLQNKP
ncbi:putative nuclease of restriction endonuclease-like (RecB) superfamily [Paraburkholderia terricola]|uniref:Nuclease of restriction endonuclease-like (RecB) superfamily n=1 Tax=Paraburkholderia terricola TaxID=169427 RepID=A0ABU1M2W6_9BURK|nr:PDDEXK nuclease domain-containing protein [Paraburkholderia terricola]MDR6413209.1 putative nuclease of restriction endonuclease-like (RecB) superfamily [Paraburkholderia terricola]MDR6450070.1 putative nuclease of restriction endonuclease-like (RecB) superfamily [Paraburkholderia terricola]MDR6484847.1 putative nuclease of restriction endonuclease-like (RecB) superfamily [Paraburkholderia terricola]MDR6495741.1 putative nuclease of restriction endonuclease-like (RecB) superfamily [Paraburkh